MAIHGKMFSKLYNFCTPMVISRLHADSACLRITSRAIEQKFHRNIVDLDNHLDKPDLDFFNAELNGQLKEISGL